MRCSINTENGYQYVNIIYQYVKCGDFFFIGATFNYEEAIPVCEYHNSVLAHINIKNGIPDDSSLENVSIQALSALGIDDSIHFMIGLKFERENGVWSNGEKYNSQTSGPINQSPLIQHRSCSYVVLYGDLKKLTRYPCLPSFVLCKEKLNSTNLTTLAKSKEVSTSISTIIKTSFSETSQPTTPNNSFATKISRIFKTTKRSKTTLPTTQSPFKTDISEFYTSKPVVEFSKDETKTFTTKLATDFKTPQLTTQNQHTNLIVIGMSFAIAILFFAVVILLAYIVYDKSKRTIKKEDQSKTIKTQNLSHQIKEAFQTIDELNSNEATYAEIKIKSKVKAEKSNETNENIKTNHSTLVAAYTKVEENKCLRKAENDKTKELSSKS